MTIEQAVLAAMRALPPDRQQTVLDFAEYLRAKSAPPADRPTALGLWADLGIDISDEDIAEARREMWGSFPREQARGRGSLRSSP